MTDQEPDEVDVFDKHGIIVGHIVRNMSTPAHTWQVQGGKRVPAIIFDCSFSDLGFAEQYWSDRLPGCRFIAKPTKEE